MNKTQVIITEKHVAKGNNDDEWRSPAALAINELLKPKYHAFDGETFCSIYEKKTQQLELVLPLPARFSNFIRSLYSSDWRKHVKLPAAFRVGIPAKYLRGT